MNAFSNSMLLTPSRVYVVPPQGSPFTLAVMEPAAPAPAAASGALPKPVATEPGTVCTSCENTLPFRGRLTTSWVLRTSPIDELVVFTSGLSPVTSTDYVAAPNCSVTSTRATPSTVTTFPVETVVRNPGALTSTL